jgi:hypothetical protein
VIAAIVRRAAAAKRRPAEAGSVEPTAAPMHAVRARGRACRIHCRTTHILPIPVLHPLPDITIHVIEPPGVRLKLPYRVRLPFSIPVIPGIASELALTIPKAGA